MTPKQNLTIDDIARELGVSKTTVSRAISGKGRISEATRQRVREYIGQRNYRPSAAARALAESRTGNLALVLPRSFITLDQPFTRRSMSAICDEAFLMDYYVLLCLSTDDTDAPLLRTLDDRKVDGVILARTVENDALVELLHRRSIPFATMGSLPARFRGLAAVEADHDQTGGCRAFAMEFLRDTQEQVAVLGNDMTYIVNQSRLSGIREAVSALGFPQERIRFHLDLKTPELVRSALDRALEDGATRLLMMDDGICMLAAARLEQLGLRIPRDVKVACLYDSEQLARHDPPISALQFDASELGRVTCRELLRCLQEETHDPHPVLGYRILHRDSF